MVNITPDEAKQIIGEQQITIYVLHRKIAVLEENLKLLEKKCLDLEKK